MVPVRALSLLVFSPPARIVNRLHHLLAFPLSNGGVPRCSGGFHTSFFNLAWRLAGDRVAELKVLERRVFIQRLCRCLADPGWSRYVHGGGLKNVAHRPLSRSGVRVFYPACETLLLQSFEQLRTADEKLGQ